MIFINKLVNQNNFPGSHSFYLIVILLFGNYQELFALTLNLAENCTSSQAFFCTLKNINVPYGDTLFIENASVPQLTELIIRDSILKKLPQDLFNVAPRLHGLILQNTNINYVDGRELTRALQLKKLAVQQDRLLELPAMAFSAAFSLEELYLDSNKIVDLHQDTFEGLSKLKYLAMQQNSLHALPDSVFSDLINLEHLDLSGNEIQHLQRDTFVANQKLKTLLLNDNKFLAFEHSVLEPLPHLHLLDISNNAVGEIHVQSVDIMLVQNSNLRHCVIKGSVIKLHASNNYLKGIEVGDKAAVRELDLHGNQFESLEDLVGMFNLQHLDLSKNLVQNLHTSHSPLYLPLPSLTNLNMASNQLKNITTNDFILLRKLTHLDLAFNHLLTLDASVFESLINLQKLFIEGNKLKTLAYETLMDSRFHPHLKEIGLFDNEWELSYLREMVTFLQERKTILPVRFALSNAHELRASGGTTTRPAGVAIERDNTKNSNTHHRYASTATTENVTTLEKDYGKEQKLSGIHTYWTLHDIFTVVTLSIVLIILLLILYRFMQEDQCLLALQNWWRRPRSARRTVNTHQRLDEEDSQI